MSPLSWWRKRKKGKGNPPEARDWRDQLCQVCRSLDFGLSDHTPLERQNLGYLSEVKARAPSCTFCNLAAHEVEEGLKQYPKRPKNLPIMCFLKTTGRYDGISHQNIRYISFHGKHGDYIGYVDYSGRPLQHAVLPLSLADGSVKETRHFRKSGRLLKPFVDVSLLRAWIELCERYHTTCSNPLWQSPSEWPTRLRLLDVRDRCIAEVPEQCRYAALSFVWGPFAAINFFFLTKKSICELKQKNTVPIEKLPQTVSNAVDLVREMGERFIWVDFLCILQDDPVDFNHQLDQMDTMYSQAAFTICAGTSENATAGLPCLSRPRSWPQRFAQISEHYSLVNNLEGAFWGNKWRTRGWTFQEDLLSRRQIVFTDHQVYWRCLEDHWTEETIYEPAEAGQRNAAELWNDYLAKPNAEEDQIRDSREGGRFALVNFSTIMNQYSQREFTKKSDIVRASKGFLRRISLTSGESFHWGLPQTKFEEGLLWTGSRGPPVKLNCKHGMLKPDGSSQDIAVPSWSWFAWRCDVNWEGTTIRPHRHILIRDQDSIIAEQEEFRRDSTLCWYKVGANGELLLLDRPVLTAARAGVRRPLPPWKAASVNCASIANRAHAMFVDSGRLQVETSHSELRIAKDPGERSDQYDGHSDASTIRM